VVNSSDYQLRREGPWRLLVLPERWSDELQGCVISRVRKEEFSKHPRTIRCEMAGPDVHKSYFIKLFHRHGIGDAIKDLFRRSKPKRFWHQGLALSSAGFGVPTTVAVGEVRRFRVFERGFVMTLPIPGQPLPDFLEDLAGARRKRGDLKLKRRGLARLADLIRQFHRLGFVHGDLIASNLLISVTSDGEPQFYFMDNDRTGHFSSWWRGRGWKRNLVQLNRMPLPGITLQDRMRFFRRYLGQRRLSRRDRQLVRWLEQQTRRRRYECDGVDPRGNFRRLMRFSEVATSIDR